MPKLTIGQYNNSSLTTQKSSYLMVLDKDKEKEKIATPQLTISTLAREQLNLMVIHDITLHDKALRIEIS